MRPVKFWLWLIPDPVTGKQRKTRYRMTEADALAQWPNATPVPGTEEVRHLPETVEEADTLRTSLYLNNKGQG